ncbi:MAG: restriction endonuclease subunit S [Bacteroidaceae bacterium]|nr:restriction endonuclease subunit S [Bacteroidaceae bacterium]
MSAVEWKPLKDVCNILNGFAFKSQEYVKDGVRIIRISDVQSGYISDKDLVFYSLDKLDEFKRYLLNTGDLVMSLTGNPGRVALVTNANMPCALNQRVACLRAKNICNSYLFYLFNSKEFEATAFANSTGGAQKNLSTTWLGDFEIPIPSLAKQQEIVSHLDTFTTLISNLESELDMRRKQYEHYRNQLLNFEGVEKLPLSDVFEMRGGYTPSTKNEEFWEDGILPWFRMEDIRENGNILSDSTLHITPIAVKKNGLFPVNSIILATSATIGVHALLRVPALSNQRFTAFYPKAGFKDKVNYKYTYYVFYIIDEWCKNNTVQGGFASVDMAGLRKYMFPIPSLAKQQEIVEKLDAFENLIQSLEQEIKLRKQQYEYYREKLLTFEKE